MYSVRTPQITERISLGNDIVGFNVLDIETTDSTNFTMGQREIRLNINPLNFEISHYHKRCIKFGVSIFRFAFRTEFMYGKTEQL